MSLRLSISASSTSSSDRPSPPQYLEEADALKKDRYIKGSSIFCTGAGCYNLDSTLADHKQRLQIEEFLSVNRQLIHWCNWVSKIFVETEQKTARRHAFVEERLIQLGVLKGWELLEAEEGEESNDGVEKSRADERETMPEDPGKRVKAQNNEGKRTIMDGNPGIEDGASECRYAEREGIMIWRVAIHIYQQGGIQRAEVGSSELPYRYTLAFANAYHHCLVTVIAFAKFTAIKMQNKKFRLACGPDRK
ncbi:hypothetical protein V8E51_001715 [Hyaloscypha variabilis]